MLSNLAALYQDLILEHSSNPLNQGELATPPAYQRVGANPLCGDKLVAYIEYENEKILNIKFRGEGCSIFMSAASILSQALIGKTKNEATQLLSLFMTLITLTEEPKDMNDTDMKKLGKLVVFKNIRNYPARVKCAALFARTIESLIHNPDEKIIISSDDED
ncbi:MAG: Fe-S cluster assembly sulfur transfer protein SufU [Spirochaetia bacterium]